MAQVNNNGKMPLFERMLALALTPTSIAQAATGVAENDTTTAVYDMLRDWKVFRTLRMRLGRHNACKSAGDLHHASALLAALKHPAIVRLPEVNDTFTALLGKNQVRSARRPPARLLQRHLEKRTATTPILRLLMDHLRTVARRSSAHDDPKNSKLVRMFASFHGHGGDDDPNQRIDQFLSFQPFPFESALQKKALRRRSVENAVGAAVAQFLKESAEIGEQTYAQPTLIVSLSNRLLPWPEAYAADPNTRQLGARYLSSMKLSRIGRHPSLSASAADRQASISAESPLHSLCSCLWGEDGGSMAAAPKRSALVPILDDLVLQASQAPSHFPTGEWEAALIESLTLLEGDDERPFRLLVIIESTLLNWHFENRVGGLGDRLRSTFDELIARFGAVDDVTDVQRLILFSLCSRVSHHVADFRKEPERPQWLNLKELIQFVIGFVFVEDGPLVFASVDALYDQGRCLDEGLLLVCDDILAKTLRPDLEAAADPRSNARRSWAALRASQAVFKEAIGTLELIKKIQAGDRQTELFGVVKGVRRVLVDSRKSTDSNAGVAARLKNLIPFKSSTTPSAARKEGDQKAKRPSLTLLASATLGKLARQALAESIERHRNQRGDSPALIRRVSQKREIRRKSLSEIEQMSQSVAMPPTIPEPQPQPQPQEQQVAETTPSSPQPHNRRRSSFPNQIVMEMPLASSSMSDDELSASEQDLPAMKSMPVPDPNNIAELIAE